MLEEYWQAVGTDRLREIEWTLLTIELGVIVLLVLVVFRPATAYVGQSITELAAGLMGRAPTVE